MPIAMDTITHALIGLICGELAPNNIKHRRKIGLFFGMMPDIVVILILHPYLGWELGYKIPFAMPSDFLDNTAILDHWTYHLWLLSHSLLFWAIIFLPFWHKSSKAKLATIAYFLHILADIPSHSGIYGLEPFYPIPYVFSGWFDAWLWSIWPIIISITCTLILYLIVRRLRTYYLWPSEDINYQLAN